MYQYTSFVWNYQYFNPKMSSSKRKALIKDILANVFVKYFDLEIKNNVLRIINDSKIPNVSIYLTINQYLTKRNEGSFLVIDGDFIPKFGSIQIISKYI